jgi:hypothetical protein
MSDTSHAPVISQLAAATPQLRTRRYIWISAKAGVVRALVSVTVGDDDDGEDDDARTGRRAGSH